MKEKFTILSLNNKKYHIKHANDNINDNIVFAVDYNDTLTEGSKIKLNIIYDSIAGICMKEIEAICVSPREKGVKKIAYTFRRRQNYARKVGSSNLFSYLQANLGGN